MAITSVKHIRRSRSSSRAAGNRAQSFLDVSSGPFYGYSRLGATPQPGVIQNWWWQGVMGGAKAHHDGIKAFSETDFMEDLKAVAVPTLVMHGGDHQVVPIANSALLSAKLVKGAALKVYQGLSHGLCATHPDLANADLLAFIKGDAGEGVRQTGIQPVPGEISARGSRSGTGAVGQRARPGR